MYLDEQELLSRLGLGKPVEQWLGVEHKTGHDILKWLRIDREKDAYAVSYFEMFDDGREDFLDVYSFEFVDPEQPYGVVTICTGYNDALSTCLEKYGYLRDRFIGSGMIQEEYRQYRPSRRDKIGGSHQI